MYYEEKEMNNQLYFRTSPKGEWRLMSNKKLTGMILFLRMKLENAENYIQELQEMLDYNEPL